MLARGEDGTHHEVQAKGIHELGPELVHDLKATGGENDGKGEPEAAVGGEGGGAEGVADGHFPKQTSSATIHSLCRTFRLHGGKKRKV